jgi:hypothetical protein
MGEVARQFEKAHTAVCGICGGPRTKIIVGVTGQTVAGAVEHWCVHACMRCDTDSYGNGFGPPLFVAEWSARRSDLYGNDERGSE